MEKKIKLLPPIMPMFIATEMNSLKNPHTLSITTLTEEEAVEYGEVMKQAFIEHHKKLTKPKNSSPTVLDALSKSNNKFRKR